MFSTIAATDIAFSLHEVYRLQPSLEKGAAVVCSTACCSMFDNANASMACSRSTYPRRCGKGLLDRIAHQST